ncbi:MAG: hypothetical protein ACI8TP_000824 [Acidimicrobiales bacterium]
MAQDGYSRRPLTKVKRLLESKLLAFWRWRDPPPVLPKHPFSMNPSDNVQTAMNLVMPLADPSPIARARLVGALAPAIEEVHSGLNNTGIVHFGRFIIVDGSLCMFSIYDGDFSNYIRDFIYNIGGAFDALLEFVANPPPLPVESHPDAFIEWVIEHDAFQLPEQVTELSDDPLKLPRNLALVLDAEPNAQVFVYRAYPGFSAAQIRDALKIGW